MKHIFFFLLIPFFGYSQTITDTLSNANGNLIIRILDASDTIKVNDEIESIDFEIQIIEDQIKDLQEQLKIVRKKRSKFVAVKEEKKNNAKANNSPKDSPF